MLSKLTANHLMAAILQKSKQFQTTMNFQTPSTLTKKGPFLHACTLLQNNISPWCLPQSVSLLDRVCTWQPSSVPQCNFCWYSMLYRKYYTEDKHLHQSYFQCRIRVYCFIHWKVELQWGDPQSLPLLFALSDVLACKQAIGIGEKPCRNINFQSWL